MDWENETRIYIYLEGKFLQVVDFEKDYLKVEIRT